MSTTADLVIRFTRCENCGNPLEYCKCEPVPDYNPNGTANPIGDAAYWRARAERAEAAVAAEMPSIQEVNRLYEHILELKKREVKLEAALAAVKEANRWIPIEERLPDRPGKYLWAWRGTSQMIFDISYYEPVWGAVHSTITHWRPIEPPKEGEK